MFFSVLRNFINLSIRNKIIFLFSILLIIPIIIIGLFTYNYIISVVQKRAVDYTSEIQHSIISKTDSYFSQMNDLLMNIAYETNDMTSLDLSRRAMPDNETRQDNKTLQYLKETDQIYNVLLASTRKSKYINSISLYTESRNVLAYKTIYNVNNSYSPDNEDWFKKVQASKREIIISNTHRDNQLIDNSKSNVITIARKIYNPADYSEIGILAMNISLDAINDLYKDILKNEGVKVYFVNGDGFINYCNDNSQYMGYLDAEIKSDILNPEGIFTFFDNDGAKMFATYQTSSLTGWKILFTMKYSNLVLEANVLKAVIIIVIIFLCSFLYFLIVYFSKRIVRPIKNLELGMSTAIQSNFKNKLDITSIDEVGRLGEKFNLMLDKINQLISDVYYEQDLKRQAEINALQAQINPHFLYNTLNTIKLMAVLQKSDKIANTIDSLVKLLQFTAKKTEEFVSIKDEVTALQDYIEIQKVRYYNKIKFIFEIEEATLSFKTLKFTLQPFIENSIFHGLEPRGGKGTITVKIFRQEDDICFTVRDDGTGMDEATLNNLLNTDHENKNSFNKIGIKNVHQRIKLYFGYQYGVNIKSHINAGTEAQIKIPVIL
ncbi:sensor histidine kinase [Ruminiclostridium cellobioparum]|uniref:Putative signal transduction protein with a C-terminal ATPase domain n=1 Tax=Ruminiclostridium cellobioparum subsp. termitidis CT1112 TaxID=1195236 RepID=S0FZV4_RUMCE|nr:sensor histidine kinase [Ruminiclostridium cellobioparum]EMS74088.1 putative signal transduction protein with a C-terminal ATPase domain [Ruminiclostridium cellobioparum subsp. termitidis CT1112]